MKLSILCNVIFAITLNVFIVFVDMPLIMASVLNVLLMTIMFVFYELKLFNATHKCEYNGCHYDFFFVSNTDTIRFLPLNSIETNDLYMTLSDNGIENLDGCSMKFSMIDSMNNYKIELKKGNKVIWNNWDNLK